MEDVVRKILSEYENHDFTIGDLLDEIAHLRTVRTAYIDFESVGTGKDRKEIRREVTYEEVVQKAKRLASTLMTSGVRPGDRVALLRQSGPEWVISFFAVLLCRAVVLPIDIKLGTREIFDIFKNAEPKAMITSPQFKSIVEQAERTFPGIIPILVSSTSLDKASVTRRFRKLKLSGLHFNELAVIVYTSGSTSNPKGVMVRLSNLLYEVHAMLETQPIDSRTKALSILPPNHLFELCCGILTPFFSGGQVVFSKSLLPEDIIGQIRSEKITDIVCVPLFLKVLKKGIQAKLNRSKLGSAWFSATSQLASRTSSKRIRRNLFLPIHLQLGNSLKRFYCGGAPLEKSVAEFFELVGFSPLAGYGLTETSPVISINAENGNRIGSVGRALPGVEVQISPSGEILVRGPNVMNGYLNAPELTANAIDSDGWFHTADLGHIDNEGFIYITGRCKDLIVLGNGKKVFPNEVEEMLSPLIDAQKMKELCVVGATGGPQSDSPHEEVCVVVVAPTLEEESLRQEILKACRPYAAYKRPTRIIVRRESLPVTTSLKVNRTAVKNWIEAKTESVL